MIYTIETNQSYQKCKEILTARHIISQWLSTVCVFKWFEIVSSHQTSGPVTSVITPGNNT